MAISFAMGIQNSITSSFSPMTLRTSHVSGTVLDIGLTVGMMIRNRNLEGLWKIQVHAPTLCSYWIGAVVGCFVYTVWGVAALYVNATAGLLLGVITFIIMYTPACSFVDAQLQEDKNIMMEERKKEHDANQIAQKLHHESTYGSTSNAYTHHTEPNSQQNAFQPSYNPLLQKL